MRLQALTLVLALAACDEADPEARALVARYGCVSCHEIPNVPGPRGNSGPPLTHMPRQVYVAGVAPNTPEVLARFIADPQAIDPRSAMPDLGVSAEEARIIAGFLLGIGG
ncbi:c-type cytochrome [Roseitranquillus sediminis]|uniref:c-type cytochrome n=1 Tax=Roseitranquillus sediminis TaxID=2809051 RepID=UPI001D0BFCD4|nr:hypothetical protein [Roseitranquillus sediminis]MBM9595999.1 hypothetical protein [Roseitranquillus sediminis]